MIIVQIATALAIGAYAVLSRDALYRHVDATPREWFMTAFSRSVQDFPYWTRVISPD